jgi:hypothetical protein
MPLRPIPRIPASSGPRRQVVCCASATLVIDELMPDAEHRPLAVDLDSLQTFVCLMAENGWSAHLSRMAFDRIYARERLEFAKTCGNRRLSAMASVLLYRHYGQNQPIRLQLRRKA